MRTITLSGWGQPQDALSAIAPHAHSIDYARHSTIDAALSDIAAQIQADDLVIGWSLGGQLAVRAIAAGLCKPRTLVLIAAPFQFVATRENPLGMKRFLYDKFRENYARNPERTLHKAQELIVKGDSDEDEIRHYLNQQNISALLQKDWLHWLDMLEDFSCNALDFSHFPPTLLLHGENDQVVAAEQSNYFAKAIAHAKLHLYPACGHAPHWHATEHVAAMIKEFPHV